MKIYKKNTFVIVLTKEEAIKYISDDKLERYYSKKYNGYAFSPLLSNFTDISDILSDKQYKKVLTLINSDNVTDITDNIDEL